MFNNNSNEPIFIQVATWIENKILDGIYKEDTKIISTTEMSINYKINPATVLKGYNLLIDKSIIYKKRGIGMFVSVGAYETLKKERENNLINVEIEKLLLSCKQLGITKEDLINKIIKLGENL